MYSLVKAIVKPSAIDNRWLEADISNIQLRNLYRQYHRIIVVLRHSTQKDLMSLDLDKIKSSTISSTRTFPQYLASLGRTALATSKTLPELSDRYVRYADAVRAGYKLKPVNNGKAHDAEINDGNKESVYITREDTNWEDFKKYCMVMVNGYFHLVDVDGRGAYLLNANESNAVSGEALVGLLSFRKLGTIKHKPIKANMIHPMGSSALKDNLIIDCGERIVGKTVILVAAGYMHVLDKRCFYQYNDTCILVKPAKMNLIERYHETRRVLDLSRLTMEQPKEHESFIQLAQFWSDDNIKAWFTLPQSFLVILDNAEIYAEKEYVRTPPTPGLLISMVEPDKPLFHTHGRVVNYWSVEDRGQWALYCNDNQWARQVYSTMNPVETTALTDAERTQYPTEHSRAYFLKIGSDIKL